MLEIGWYGVVFVLYEEFGVRRYDCPEEISEFGYENEGFEREFDEIRCVEVESWSCEHRKIFLRVLEAFSRFYEFWNHKIE